MLNTASALLLRKEIQAFHADRFVTKKISMRYLEEKFAYLQAERIASARADTSIFCAMA